MRTCQEAHIRVMCDHHPAALEHLGLDQNATEEEAAELYDMMAKRFEAWTGKPLKSFQNR